MSYRMTTPVGGDLSDEELRQLEELFKLEPNSVIKATRTGVLDLRITKRAPPITKITLTAKIDVQVPARDVEHHDALGLHETRRGERASGAQGLEGARDRVVVKPDFPEFDGGESGWDVVIPGDTDGSFAYGCSHNSKGNLVTSTKMVHFGWTNGSDEPSFEWLVELHDGRFLHVEGWHDYTGWDCQSGVSVCAVGATLAEVAAHLTDDPRRVYAEQSQAK